MSERYPSHYSSTALMSLSGSLLSIVYALCLERDWSQWRLGWNVRLLTVAYSVCYNLLNNNNTPFIALALSSH